MKWLCKHTPCRNVIYSLLILSLAGFSTKLFAQPDWMNSINGFVEPYRVIPTPACAELSVDNEGNIILLSRNSGLIYKYLAAFNYDSSIVAGGKGRGTEGVIQAAKIVVPNRQQLYVLDAAQSRILLLNTNFKFIHSLDFITSSAFDISLDEIEIIPQTFGVNTIGELFVLNQLDYKIYKFNQQSKISLQFGGTDYGLGSLTNPVDIQAHEDQNIYVSDTLNQRIIVFNNYGLYLYTLDEPLDETWFRFRLFDQYLIYITPFSIHLQFIPTRQMLKIPIKLDSPLIDLQFTKDFIYLLFEKGVYLYKITG